MSNFFKWILTITIGVSILALLIVPDYYGSCREARVYNEQNGTSYTCGDFFWADKQINQQTQTLRLEGEINDMLELLEQSN